VHRKIISFVSIAAVISVSILVTLWNDDVERYHQHQNDSETVECTHSEDVFCTNLPLVYINTEGQEIPAIPEDSTMIQATIDIYDSDDSNNHLTDEATVESLIDIRARGYSSIYFDKKNYLIHLVNSDRSENEQEIMGMEKHDEWVLHGPFIDKTLMRNYMVMNLSGQIMEYAPDVRFCEVFVNDEYMGVYVMMESVSRGEGRVDITRYGEGDSFTSYIVRLDRGTSEDEELDSFTAYTYSTTSIMNVIYPSKKFLTEELLTYIEQDVSKYEKVLYSYDYDDNELGYDKYLDVGSFVDVMIINEFTQNYDAGIFSTYMYKDTKGKLKIGPVWDFNNSCDNYVEVTHDATGFSFQNKVLYFMLMKDEDFVKLVIQKYKILRKTILSDDYLTSYIDDVAVYLDDAKDRNFEKWGYTFLNENGLLKPVKRNLNSYEEAVAQLKNFLLARGEWLDDNIDSLMQYCHESRNVIYND
jgi:hypothetical protein